MDSSALTTSMRIVAAMTTSVAALLQRLRLLDRFLDRADHVERLLGQVVVLTVHDRLEAADRVLERHVLSRTAGEDFRDVEGLRKETLDLARPGHRQLVLGRELVHP